MNRYKIIKNEDFDYSDIKNIINLYSLILNVDEINYYIFMQLSNNGIGDINKMFNYNEDDFLLLRRKLESVGLIKTFKNKSNEYLILILIPLNKNDFFKNEIFKRLSSTKINEKNINNLLNNHNITSDFKDISCGISSLELNEVEEEVLSFKKDDEQMSENFSLNSFLNNVSEINFPKPIRTKENINKIISISDLYGLNFKQLEELLAQTVDYEKMTFDLSAFENKAIRFVIKSDEEMEYKNPYYLPTVHFMQKICKKQMLPIDKNIVRKISNSYGIKYYIINYLIEINLKKYNKLTYTNMEVLASEVVKNKLDNLDDVIKYYEEIENKKFKKVIIDQKYSKDDEDSVEDLMKKMEAIRYEKNR